jgi:hypothetical protein
MIERRFEDDDKAPIVALYWPGPTEPEVKVGDGPMQARRIDVVYVSGQGGYATWFEVELNVGRVLQHNAAFVETVERGEKPPPPKTGS